MQDNIVHVLCLWKITHAYRMQRPNLVLIFILIIIMAIYVNSGIAIMQYHNFLKRWCLTLTPVNCIVTGNNNHTNTSDFVGWELSICTKK